MSTQTPQNPLTDTTRTVRAQLSQTFRSFRHRNFRLYFAGQFLSLCGTWMQNLDVSWLVYRLTQSAWMLGLVSFASLTPTLVFGLAGGHAADKFNRKKIVLFAQITGLLQSAMLAYLTLTGQIQVWQIFVLTALLGTANAFDIPARQSLIASLVTREDLINAVSLNASMFNGARMIGPALAGGIITFWGEGTCFAVNSVSYLAVILAVYLLHFEKRIDRRQAPASEPPLAGIHFVIQHKSVGSLLLMVSVLSLFGMQYLMLLPVITKSVLHGKAILLGALSGMSGLGSLAAALLLANRGTGENLRRAVGFALLAFSLALLCFALSTNVWLSLALVVLVAFFMTFQLSSCQSLIQLAAPDHLRGKVMSVYMMIFMGMGPAGSLAAGWLARQCGAPYALAIAAGICSIAAFIYLFFDPGGVASQASNDAV